MRVRERRLLRAKVIDLRARAPPPRLTFPLGLVGAGLFCEIFVFQFDCNLLIFNRDELRCFLAKQLILNG
jgi:hypothetical protein